MQVNVCSGITVYAYESTIEPGRWVIEIETSEGGVCRHDAQGRPQIKVMVNEAIVSNDGPEG